MEQNLTAVFPGINPLSLHLEWVRLSKVSSHYTSCETLLNILFIVVQAGTKDY